MTLNLPVGLPGLRARAFFMHWTELTRQHYGAIMWRRVKQFAVLVVVLAVLVPLAFRGTAMLRETSDLSAVVPAHGTLIQTASGAIFVQEAGPPDGPILLFAHGTAAWSELWRPTMDAMAEQGYRAIGFDMPPFGFSDHFADGIYTRETLAQVILDLIDAMQIKPILVAHSFGAGPGVEAVMIDQSKFAGLVVVAGAIGLDSHLDPKKLPRPIRPAVLREIAVAATMNNPLLTRRLLAGLIHVKSAATPARARFLALPFQRNNTTTAYAAWLPVLLSTQESALSVRPENYAALTLPVAYIWGDQDTVTPIQQGNALAQITPGASMHSLMDVGHIPQIEAADAFNRTLSQAVLGFAN